MVRNNVLKYQVGKLEGEVNKMGELNKEYEANNARLEESCSKLEGQVTKMTEENQKFEENNKKLEEQVGQLGVSYILDNDSTVCTRFEQEFLAWSYQISIWDWCPLSIVLKSSCECPSFMKRL